MITPISLLLLIALGQGSETVVPFTADGPQTPSALIGVSKDFDIRLETGMIRASELVELRAFGARRPPFPRDNFLRLANDDILPLAPGTAVRLDEERLHVSLAEPLRAKAGPRLVLPQAAAALWVRPGAAHRDEAMPGWTRLIRTDPATDIVMRSRGETADGTLLQIGGTVHLQVGARRVEIANDKVEAVAWNGSLQARPRLRKAHAQAVLANGARLTCVRLHYDTQQKLFTAVLPYGAAVEFPRRQLVTLELRHDNVAYLSDLTPSRRQSTPFLDLTRPIGLDKTGTGLPLELAGSGYRKGLWAACPSELEYALNGEYRWFETVIGVDPAAPRGLLRFRLSLDGKLMDLTKTEIGSDDGPFPVRIKVQGCEKLTLITDCGSRGNVHGYGIWAAARLIK